MSDNEEQVRQAIEDIAINPSSVGLTHAKILRDEIIRLRSRVASVLSLHRRDERDDEGSDRLNTVLGGEHVLRLLSKMPDARTLSEERLMEYVQALKSKPLTHYERVWVARAAVNVNDTFVVDGVAYVAGAPGWSVLDLSAPKGDPASE